MAGPNKVGLRPQPAFQADKGHLNPYACMRRACARVPTTHCLPTHLLPAYLLPPPGIRALEKLHVGASLGSQGRCRGIPTVAGAGSVLKDFMEGSPQKGCNGLLGVLTLRIEALQERVLNLAHPANCNMYKHNARHPNAQSCTLYPTVESWKV